MHHLDNRRHPAAFFADPPRPRAVKLHFARRVGAIAELRFSLCK